MLMVRFQEETRIPAGSSQVGYQLPANEAPLALKLMDAGEHSGSGCCGNPVISDSKCEIGRVADMKSGVCAAGSMVPLGPDDGDSGRVRL